MVRGVRGATTIEIDCKEEIIEATQELLSAMVDRNGIDNEDIASAFFSCSPQIHSSFPAEAARMVGWTWVPLFCAQELDITGSLPNCIRVIIHWNTTKAACDIKHVYLRRAEKLRPDLKE